MKRKKIKTRSWDVVEHLKTDEDMASYLEAVLEDGDPTLISAALGDIARARGMAEIAREAGLGIKRKANRTMASIPTRNNIGLNLAKLVLREGYAQRSASESFGIRMMG